MSRHWNWDFESEKRAAPMPAPGEPQGAPQPRRTRVQRRRGGAALLAVGVLAIVIGIVAGSHGHGSGSDASATARSRPKGRAQGQAKSSQRGELAAVSAVLAYTPFVRHGGARGREIALTFDDGPGPYTPEVLAVLERLHTRATFFAIGAMERYFSASTIREIRDGDVIGDHTETHPELARLSAHEQHEQLLEQIARIELVGGPRPTLFRPPYGSFDATTMRQLRKLHLLMVLWSVDTGDYLRPGVHVIVQRVLAGARPGAIMLLHDAGGDRSQTVAALPAIIKDLRARGYRLVTVPRLLADDPPPPGEALPPSLAGD